MLIDFHTHCYPPELAERAMKACPNASDGEIFFPDGTVRGLLRGMERAGVDYSVLLSVARHPGSVRDTNDFAAKLQKENPRIIALGSVHPYAPDVHEELERIVKLGLHGVKMHTTFQNFVLDDPRCEAVFRHIGRLGLTTVFHMGNATMGPDLRATLSIPSRLAKVIDFFDGAPVVAAHMGGYIDPALDPAAELRILAQLPVYTDVAYVNAVMKPEKARELVDLFGEDRVLFGSDTPWNTPEQEKAFWDAIDLPTEMREKIYWKNAVGLLKKMGVTIQENLAL